MNSRETRTRLERFSQQDVREQTPLDLRLLLPENEDLITCTRAVRIIRGKRLVCFGTWGAKPVVVKLYFDPKKARRNWRKSLSGAETFLDKGLPAPEILYSGRLDTSGVYILIFQALSDAIRLDQALTRASSQEERQGLKELLITCLAQHHRQGVLQGDQHLGNFLLEQGTLYALDGDQVRSFSGPVPRTKAFASLAAFFSVFPEEDDAAIPDLLEVYCAQRGLPLAEKTASRVAACTGRMRQRRLQQYLRKIYRNRDPFVLEQSRRRFCVYDLRTWHQAYAPIKDNPLAFVSVSGCTPPQERVLNTADGPVRLYFEASGPGSIFWKKGRVARMWTRAHRAIRLGRPQPKPIMFLRIKTGRFRWNSFLLTETGPGSQERTGL